MERSDLMEPLEAGEDGTFDLGSPSPPPSPVRPAGGIPRAQDAEGSEAAPAAESEPCGSPPIKDDWEKVDLQEVVEEEGKQSPPEGCSPAPAAAAAAAAAAGAAGGGDGGESPPTSGESLEDFEDAVEMKPQGDEGGGADQDDAERVTGESDGGAAESSEGTRPPANTETLEAAPAAAGGRASAIAPGLANVRLPMGYDKPPGPGERSAGEPMGDSSDGEDEFHDAYDSGPGMVKDAAKAREMKETGNTHYRNKEFEDAVDYYTMALHYCPEDDEHKKDRAVYLANRAQGHMQLKEYDTVVEDCTAALELDPRYVKALLRRAQANENLEKYDLALEDAKALLEIDPGLRPARESVPRLEKLNNEKNERMKEEALGKLKELGNSILGNFGLSTDNFKMKQDPNTGSYSINFER